MSRAKPNPTACVIIIGNEILSGRTKDVNLSHLGVELNESGITLSEARIVPDVPDAIISAVNECRAKFDYVFTTGGIGPTHDDITSECIAHAFGVDYELNDEAYEILKAHYKPGELNDARMRMARMPAGAELIENPISKAPGYCVGNVYVMAGVPMIMRSMFDSIRHQLSGGSPVLSRTVGGTIGEGKLASELAKVQKRYSDIDIGSYPFFRGGTYGTSIVLRSRNEGKLEAATDEVSRLISSFGVDPYLGESKTS